MAWGGGGGGGGVCSNGLIYQTWAFYDATLACVWCSRRFPLSLIKAITFDTNVGLKLLLDTSRSGLQQSATPHLRASVGGKKWSNSPVPAVWKQPTLLPSIDTKICQFIQLWHFVSFQASAYWISSIFPVKWHSLETKMVSIKANISLPWFRNSTSWGHSCHFETPVQCGTSREVERGHSIGYVFMKLARFYEKLCLWQFLYYFTFRNQEVVET